MVNFHYLATLHFLLYTVNQICQIHVSTNFMFQPNTGVDPGFHIGGGVNPLGGAPTYDLTKFCRKLHDIEKILGRRDSRAAGIWKQESIPVGCVPSAVIAVCPSGGVFSSHGVLSVCGCLPGEVLPDTPSPCEQNDWQTGWAVPFRPSKRLITLSLIKLFLCVTLYYCLFAYACNKPDLLEIGCVCLHLTL